MSRPVYKEVVSTADPILVLARGGHVFIKQDAATIILDDTAVEQLSESIMKAGAASIRVRTHLSSDASQTHKHHSSTVTGDAVTESHL